MRDRYADELPQFMDRLCVLINCSDMGGPEKDRHIRSHIGKQPRTMLGNKEHLPGNAPRWLGGILNMCEKQGPDGQDAILIPTCKREKRRSVAAPERLALASGRERRQERCHGL